MVAQFNQKVKKKRSTNFSELINLKARFVKGEEKLAEHFNGIYSSYAAVFPISGNAAVF